MSIFAQSDPDCNGVNAYGFLSFTLILWMGTGLGKICTIVLLLSFAGHADVCSVLPEDRAGLSDPEAGQSTLTPTFPQTTAQTNWLVHD